MASPRRPIDVGVSGAPSSLTRLDVVGTTGGKATTETVVPEPTRGVGRKQGLQVRPQLRATTTNAHLQPTQLPSPALDIAGAHPNALVRIDDAARYLCYRGARASEMCAKFLRAKHIKLLRRGTRLLVRRGDLDVALTRREDPAVTAVVQDVTDQIATRRLKRAAVG